MQRTVCDNCGATVEGPYTRRTSGVVEQTDDGLTQVRAEESADLCSACQPLDAPVSTPAVPAAPATPAAPTTASRSQRAGA